MILQFDVIYDVLSLLDYLMACSFVSSTFSLLGLLAERSGMTPEDFLVKESLQTVMELCPESVSFHHVYTFVLLALNSVMCCVFL